MNIYVSNIVESNKDSIIGNLGNSGKAYLSLHIDQCWRAFSVDEENQDLPIVLYCSGMMYKGNIVISNQSPVNQSALNEKTL